jgi:FlaA1/EpsC-like NDP-sugar epimerase
MDIFGMIKLPMRERGLKPLRNTIQEKGFVIMHKYNLLEKILFPSTYLNKKKLRSKLKGKTILITGASSGIGEQVAYLLADIDAHLILVARREEKLLTIKSEIEKKAAVVSIFRADLTNKEIWIVY